MKSNNHDKSERNQDYYVSVCEMHKKGDEHPLDRLKRRIQEARDRAKAERATEANTTKSE